MKNFDRVAGRFSRRERDQPPATGPTPQEFAAAIFAAHSDVLLTEARRYTEAAVSGDIDPSNLFGVVDSMGAEHVAAVRERKRSLMRKVSAETAMLELQEILNRDARLRSLHEQYGDALRDAMGRMIAARAGGATVAVEPLAETNEQEMPDVVIN